MINGSANSQGLESETKERSHRVYVQSIFFVVDKKELPDAPKRRHYARVLVAWYKMLHSWYKKCMLKYAIDLFRILRVTGEHLYKWLFFLFWGIQIELSIWINLI